MRTPQRTSSLKSSGKNRPPLYRPPAESIRLLSSNPAQNSSGMDSAASQISGTTCESNKIDRNPTGKYIRGIPNAEIIGSSESELIKSESKSEPSKRVSRLPRILSSRAQKQKTDDSNQESKALEIRSSQTQPRRNSLERPSYYNSLYKAGKSAYSGPMTKSLILSNENSLNSDVTSDTSTSTTTNSNNFQRYRSSSKIDNRNSSEYEYQSDRPSSTLGRTLSYRNPSPNISFTGNKSENLDLENKAEIKRNSSSSTNIARVSSLRETNRYSPRLLRPQSFYGGTDVNYQIADCEKQDLQKKNSFISRKSPVYQRSVSLFERDRSDHVRPLSITPDRSILGKFLTDRNDKECKEIVKDNINEKPKTRKISRFLRPDFYDTPKEDSVYEKKEKVTNISNGEIWKEKNKSSNISQKKAHKNFSDGKSQESRLSIVDRAIKSLKQNSLKKVERESMSRESNLIKRAVSLEDCSLVPEHRIRRASSLTPVSHKANCENNVTPNKYEKIFQKKRVEDFKKIVDQKLSKNKDLLSDNSTKKQDSVIKKLVRKVSPKILKHKFINSQEEKAICNGSERNCEVNALEDVANQETCSRLSRIAGLKKLEFSRPVISADSTPSMEDSKMSGELDDSSSFLSPTEDGSDTWSISSDYTDAREYSTPLSNADSVSERIRRKSFYSRFNQSKRRKSSQSSQFTGSRTRLPMYSKSMSSDFSNMNLSTPDRKKSNPETPV